jgi:hypothetical protein
MHLTTIPIRIGVTGSLAFHVPTPPVPERIEPDAVGPMRELSVIVLLLKPLRARRAETSERPTGST